MFRPFPLEECHSYWIIVFDPRELCNLFIASVLNDDGYQAAVPRNPSRPPKRVVLPYVSEFGPLEEANLLQEVRTMLPPPSVAQNLCKIYQEYGRYLYAMTSPPTFPS